MAGQNNNAIVYEFQGNTLPLEKAFSKVGSLFRKFIKDAKQASDSGALSPDQLALEKEFKNYYKRLKALKDKKGTASGLTKDEEKEAEKIYKQLLKITEKFKKEQGKILAQKGKEQERAEKERQKRQEEVSDYSSISSQFRAGMQVEQLRELTSNVQGIPPEVLSDISKYVNTWKQVNEEYGKGIASEEELADATKALDEAYKKYSATLVKMERSQSKVVGAFETMFKRVIMMISSFEFWYRTIKEGIRLLGDYVESLNFIEVAFKNIKFSLDEQTDALKRTNDQLKSYRKYLDEARYSLGLNATELNTVNATFISFANAMNLTDDQAVEFSKNVSQLAIDMASLYNRDVLTMMTALKSSLAGNTRAMMNYGISVHDATINEWMLSKGMNLTMSQLSETSQVLARYLYIMEKTSAAQGDLSRTLRSPANQMRIFKNQLSLLTQNIGALTNTVFYPILRILNEILVPLNAFLSQLTSLSSESYSNAVGGLTDDVDLLTESLEDAGKAAAGLTGLDEINQLSDKGKSKTGINEELAELASKLGVYDNFLGKTTKLTALMRSLGDILAPVWRLLFNTDGINWVISLLDKLTWFYEPVSKFFNFMSEKLRNAPGWLQTIAGWISKLNGGLSGVLITLLTVSAAISTFKKLLASNTFTTFLNVLKATAKTFMDLSKAILTAIANMLKWIATQIKAAAQAVFTGIKNLFLAGTFWKVALGVIASAGVAAVAVAAVVGTAVAIASAVRKSNENEITNDATGLATGGVATGPTFALIGEGKYNEAVVPLGNSPQFTSMKEDIADMVVNKTTNNYGYGSKDVILNINGRELARAILPDLQNTLPQTGMKLRRA